MHIVQKLLLYLFSTIVIVAIFLLAWRSYLQVQQCASTSIQNKEGIEQLIQFEINGHQSAAFLRGEDKTNPILLFVHGGPGYPDMMFTRCYDQGLLKDFTVVRYDQRGSGKSTQGEVKDHSLTINLFIQDLLALTDSIQSMFPSSPIYLIGHSWGTVLGLKAAHQHPEKYACYIGMGQIVDEAQGDLISYRYALRQAKAAQHKQAITELNGIDSLSYQRDHASLALQRKWLKHFGGSTHMPSVRQKLQNCVLKSSEHSIVELFQIQPRGRFLDQLIFPQLLDVHFLEEIDSLALPIYFFSGSYDYHVPSVLNWKLYTHLKAPRKRFIWFEKSGHLPIYEENEKFIEEMKKLKEEI